MHVKGVLITIMGNGNIKNVYGISIKIFSFNGSYLLKIIINSDIFGPTFSLGYLNVFESQSNVF